MHVMGLVAATIIGLSLWAAPAEAAVIVQVDLTTQTMHVTSASGTCDWPVSTAREGFVTSRGLDRVQSLQVMNYSLGCHNWSMPDSIFFHTAYATGLSLQI